jgi:predicted acylesterase/phospholipase RssA
MTTPAGSNASRKGRALRSAQHDARGFDAVLTRSEFMALLGALGAVGAPGVAHAEQPPWYPLPPPLRLGKGRALVVSGAGARGAYEAGAIKWLFRNVSAGQPFDLICGTSAGAINAAFAAQGTPDSIQRDEQLWKSMPTSGILKLQPQVQNVVDGAMQVQESAKHGYPAKFRYVIRAKKEFDAAGPPQDLIKILGVMDDTGIDALVQRFPLELTSLQSSLFVTATNVTNMTSDSFYHFVGPNAARNQERFLERTSARLYHTTETPPLTLQHNAHHALTQDNFTDAVVASAAMPGVFAPVPIKRRETGDTNIYVDGGVANNTPVGLAIDAGATDITIILATAVDEVPAEPSTLPGLLQAVNTIMAQKILQNDVMLAVAKNLLARHRDWSGLNPAMQAFLTSLQDGEWTPIKLRVIRPRKALKLGVMGFKDQAAIDAAFDIGYQDAQNEWVYSAAS